MKFLTSLFKARKHKPEAKYGGFSDFLLRASQEEKITVFKEAAHKANEEQRAVFMKARSKRQTA